MDDTNTGWTPEGLRAWGKALVKTGMEHLDLTMVRQGKQTLKDATPTPVAPPSSAHPAKGPA